MFSVVVCRYNTSGVNGSTIDCFYSRTNSSLAITDLDPATNTRDLLLAFLSPILICTVSGLVILLLHRGDPSQTERRYVGHIVVVEDQRRSHSPSYLQHTNKYFWDQTCHWFNYNWLHLKLKSNRSLDRLSKRNYEIERESSAKENYDNISSQRNNNNTRYVLERFS